MRHRLHHRKLNRTMEHRKALRRNMAQSLFEHGQIETTLPKAKDLKPFCERLITLAVRSRKYTQANEHSRALIMRRRIHHLLSDRGIIPFEHQETYNGMSDSARHKSMRMASGRRYRTGEPKGRLVFTAESVTHRLIEKIAPQFEDRPGGYTRLVKLSKRRLGDSTFLAILQLVGNEESPGSITKPQKSARQRRSDSRYAFAIKLSKSRKSKSKSAPTESKNTDEPTHDSQDASDENAKE